jgi:phosphate transport system protein
MAPLSRGTLDRELEGLSSRILRQASMVDIAIEKAMEALYSRNVALAQEVILGDEEVNSVRYEIEQGCLLILATQQPAAGDLRQVVTSMHLASELERIGDHAAGIARLVERLEEEKPFDSLYKLPKMTKRARQMISEGIGAFVDWDQEKAESLMRRDAKLDKHYHKLFVETLEEMRDEDYIRRSTFLLWVGHNLERIGDRAINIAERVIFMTSGSFVENDIIMD